MEIIVKTLKQVSLIKIEFLEMKNETNECKTEDFLFAVEELINL
jgi:hypothetical protein